MKLLICLILINFVYSLPCAIRKYPAGYVCVCNNTYCDTLEDILPDENNNIVIVSSSKGGLRFSINKGVFGNNSGGKITVNDYEQEDNSTNNEIRETNINVDDDATYQNFTGFGGGLSGSASYLLNIIKKPLRDCIYKSYYSLTSGIGYNIMRLSIGCSDFDLTPWAYNEIPLNNAKLTNMTVLDYRDKIKVRQIKKLENVSNNYDIKYIASTWSPPRWMKTTYNWTGASTLKPEYYQTYADYHIKFLDLMDKENIHFWAITTGNEPINGDWAWPIVHFPSLGWQAKSQGIWVGKNLGPTFKNSKYKDVKIIGLDEQRYILPFWARGMEEADKDSIGYIYGWGIHWYSDPVSPTLWLNLTRQMYPNQTLLYTESALGDLLSKKFVPVMGLWKQAETYIHRIMEPLVNWVSLWIDWNLVLNEFGEPNNSNNNVDAPIVINSTNNNEAYKQPIFFALGHFSRFISPGSVRINCYSSILTAIAFLRPDKNIAVIINNPFDRAYAITLQHKGRGKILITIPKKSVHSVLY